MMEAGLPMAELLTDPFDYTQMMCCIRKITDAYPFCTFSYLGESILGRSIPLIRLGSGTRSVLYVGTHHGMEWITSAVLIRFLSEFCRSIQEKRPFFRIQPEVLLQVSSLYILPMLNPDGVEYQIHGVSEDNPLRERVLTMNHDDPSFTRWQANARGVDLNHNYDAGFAEYKKLSEEAGISGGAPTRFAGEAPESEPEVRMLCDWIRFHRKSLRGILTLHTQGKEIYYRSGGRCPPNAYAVARRISSFCGYRLSAAEGFASYGGLTDWCVRELSLPSFTLECGIGENPLPFSDLPAIYTELKRALFTFPVLV